MAIVYEAMRKFELAGFDPSVLSGEERLLLADRYQEDADWWMTRKGKDVGAAGAARECRHYAAILRKGIKR